MTAQLHTVQAVASVLGRFEMHFEPADGTLKPPYGLSEFIRVGFHTAASIRAFPGEGSRGPTIATLQQLGRKSGSSWQLNPPDESSQKAWALLLRTDTPFVIEAPDSLEWVEHCISELFRPVIYFTGSAALSDGPVSFCRRYLRKGDGLLLIASPHMRSISILGKGHLYEKALLASSEKASEVWGYTDRQRNDILRGGFRLFKKALL